MNDQSPVYYDPTNTPHDLRDFENIPADLRALPQWVCWKLETVDGRLTKIPYTATGSKADSTNPQTWGTFETCCAGLRSQKFFGLGFVFAEGGDLTGIDLDKHRDPTTGKLDSFAAEYVSRLNSYTETSQSGTGVHTIARATIPSDKGRRDAKSGVEMYSKARFFVMTGNHLDGTPRTVESRQKAVEGMFREVFPPKEKPTATPAPARPLTLTDHDLISKASQAKNGAQFSALWRGDYAAAGYGSQSEADATLLSALYFWTGGDKSRSFSLFTQSGLNRGKWEREDYRESTWQLIAHGETYSPASRTGSAREYLPSEAEAAQPADALPDLIDAADFLATPIEPPAELVAGILHKGSKLAFGGSSKSFKTWSLLDLAISVATGTDWLGRSTAQGKVLFVNFEIQPHAWQRRIAAVARAKGVEIQPGTIHLWNLRGHAADFKQLVPRIIERTRAENFALNILDPIYKLYGSTDENSAGNVALLLNSLEKLATDTGAAIAFGAHFAKGNASAKEAIDRISGSGVFARDPDSLLIFTKHETDDAFTVEPILRNFAPVEPFAVRWDYPLMHLAADLDPAKLKQAGGRKPTYLPADLLALLPPEGLPNADWLAKADGEGISKRTFFRLRKALESAGKIHASMTSGKWQPILTK